MSRRNDTDSPGDRAPGAIETLLADLACLMSDSCDPRLIFPEFTRILQRGFDIRKGFLAMREGNQTRFLAVALFSRGKTRKNLSLKLPTAPSLFEKVAETGRIYSENFAELFDGNLIERQLLLDDDTVAFMLRPLKHQARVVGLIGFSSDTPNTFVTFEEGLLNPAFDRLGELLGDIQPERVRP